MKHVWLSGNANDDFTGRWSKYRTIAFADWLSPVSNLACVDIGGDTGAPGPDGKPEDTPDSFLFENGTFVSKEPELRYKYPSSTG